MKYFATVGLFIFFLFFSIAPVNAASFNLPPTYLSIPSANIHLPVVEAPVAYDTWQVSLAGASFGQGTTYPGNKGNTVIFSHALSRLFGRLPEVKVGDTIHLFTDLDWFTYTVSHVEVVNPTNLSVLQANGGKKLTLYTCVGENDAMRFVVHADLITKAL